MKEKVQLTAEQMYKRNQFRAKIYKRLAPIVFWVFIGLFALFLILAISNSWGNITEIINLLDKDVYTGEELSANYQYLIEKYGEWIIIGKNAGAFSVQFVDIRAAFFSGLMITYITLSIVCLAVAVIAGKIILPKMAQYYTDNNQDMVNMATLQTNAEINRQKNKKKDKEEEWF